MTIASLIVAVGANIDGFMQPTNAVLTQLDAVEKNTGKMAANTAMSWGQMATAVGAVAGVVTGFAASVAALGSRGADVADVRESFVQLTGAVGESADVMLGRLREATLGNISDSTLMATANKAMSQGLTLTAEQMGTVGDVAAKLADRIGGDVNTAFETLTQAMATGQDRQLKTIGLNIDAAAAMADYAVSVGKTASQLSEGEKKQATVNAILAEGQRILDTAGKAQIDFGDKVGQSKTTLSNFVDTISEWIAQTPQIGTISSAITAVSGTVTALGIAWGPVSVAVMKLIPLLGLSGIGGVFTSLAGVITGTILPLISSALPMAFNALAALFTGPAGLVVAGILAVVAIWKNWDTIGPIVQRVYTAVKEWLVDKFGDAVKWIGDKVTAVTNFFRDMYVAVVGSSYVPDMVEGIAEEFGTLNTGMVDPAKRATGTVGELFKQMKTDVMDVLQNMPETFAKAFEGGGGLLGAFKSLGLQLADAIVKPIIEGLKRAAAMSISVGSSAASVIGGSVGGRGGAMVGGIASTVGGAALAGGTGLGAAAAAGSTAAMVGLAAATAGVGIAAVGAYILIKKMLDDTEKQINPVRQAFVDAAGGLDALNFAANRAGVTLDAFLDAKNPQQYAAAVGEIEAALGRFNRLSGLAGSRFGPSSVELQAMSAEAGEVFQFMLDSGTYTADQLTKVYRAYQESIVALGGAAGDAAKEWIATQDQAAKVAEMQSAAMKTLLDQRDTLMKSYENEAPEEEMGSIEAAARSAVENINKQIEAQQSAMGIAAAEQRGIIDESAIAGEKSFKDAASNIQQAMEVSAQGSADAFARSIGALDLSVTVKVNWDDAWIPQPPTPDWGGAQAAGGDYFVSRPTMFLAGEAGPEQVSFSGANKRFGRGDRGDSDGSEVDLSGLERSIDGLRRELSMRLPVMMANAVRDTMAKQRR